MLVDIFMVPQVSSLLALQGLQLRNAKDLLPEDIPADGGLSPEPQTPDPET